MDRAAKADAPAPRRDMMLETSRLLERARRSRAAHLLRGALRRYQERNLPVLSVVVPVHNSAQFLPGCVESSSPTPGRCRSSSSTTARPTIRAPSPRATPPPAAMCCSLPAARRGGCSPKPRRSARDGRLPGILRRGRCHSRAGVCPAGRSPRGQWFGPCGRGGRDPGQGAVQPA